MLYRTNNAVRCVCGAWMLFLPLTAAMPVPAAAQQEANAKNMFEAGIAAFETADYQGAAALFAAIHEGTADRALAAPAMIMAAKAYYRSNAFDSCLAVLDEFEQAYPESPYSPDARLLQQYAQTQLQNVQRVEQTVRLGVVLPVTRDNIEWTRALLAGIRAAVEDFNQRGERTIQILFRDSEHSPAAAHSAVTDLARAGAHAIVGPLYRDEADGAATASEQEEVVLIAPLANAVSFTKERRFVFQANPTIPFRGQYLAKWAVEEAGFERLGIIADASAPSSLELAEAFRTQAEQMGISVVFDHHLTSPAQWSQIASLVGIDKLENVEAVCLAVHGTRDMDIRNRVEVSLLQLQQAANVPHVLGAEAFAHVNRTMLPANLEISYVTTYHEASKKPDAVRFARRMDELGVEVGKLSVLGYDVTQMVLSNLMEQSDGPLAANLLNAPPYQGVGSVIHFGGIQHNQTMFLYRTNRRGVHRVR